MKRIALLAAVASASHIHIVQQITHVTGTQAIDNIDSPRPCIVLAADAPWYTTTRGNIASEVTAKPGTEYKACNVDGRWWITTAETTSGEPSQERLSGADGGT